MPRATSRYGDVAVLFKPELYALLVSLKTDKINAQSALTTVLLPAYRKALACAAAAAARQQPPPEMCGAPSGDGGGGGGGGGSSAAGAEGWRREEPWEVLLSALYVPDAPPAAAQPLLLTGPAE